MAYISEEKSVRVFKKNLHKNVFRYMLEIDCENCKRKFEHEINSKVKCPYCKKEKIYNHKFKGL